MSYLISEQLIKFNRSGQKLVPEGFVIHDTDDAGATAQNEHDYFNGGDRQASAHYFADWTEIIRTIPENEVAWHAGATANHKYLSVEMCVPKTQDPAKFLEVWNRTVWLVADTCVRYKWGVDKIFSHKNISDIYHESDHQDPIAFLAGYGKAWADLKTAISDQILNMIGGNDVINLKVAVLLYSKEDYWAGTDVAVKNGNCAIFIRPSDHSVPPDAMSAQKLIVVGGPTTKHLNEVLLSGNNKYDTAAAVAKYLG